MTTRFEVLLANVGNPDFGQDPGRPLPGTASGDWHPVSTWKEASDICRLYIGEMDLGGGNWSGGKVRDIETGQTVGSVSYNGRCWPSDDVSGPTLDDPDGMAEEPSSRSFGR